MLRNLFLVCILLGFFSCKKKKEEKEPEPPVQNPGRSNTMTAKVNGVNWAVKNNQTANADIEQSAGGNPKQYVFIGRAGNTTYSNSIFLYTQYATGVVDLRSSPGCSAIYFDAKGDANYIETGTMTITTMDTSHVKSDKCDKFKATFSFVTDTFGGLNTIEQGMIDFEAQ